MSVTVDSGEFRLWRNIQNLEHQPSRMAVINAWVEAYGYATPPAMNSLADVIQDVFDYPEIWRELGANSADEFLKKVGITGLNLENPARLVKALRGELGKKAKEEVLKGLKLKRHEQTIELASTVQPVARNGELGNGRESSFDNREIVKATSENQGGNSAAYQLARLKRDHPEVVERVISGEIKSARAAMREVGLAPPLLTPVQKLVRQFQRLTPDQQQDFLDAINDINP